MSSSRPGGSVAPAIALAMMTLALSTAGSLAGDRPGAVSGGASRLLPGLPSAAAGNAETVVFADPLLPPVKIVRGGVRKTAAKPQSARTEVVSFASGAVTVLRGGAPTAPRIVATTAPISSTVSETVTFADPSLPAVTVLRGIARRGGWSTDLFGPASGGELDRIAYAVDGVESRHGGDPRMWRTEADAPQGPMQVSAAAATDVGGGDRFDIGQNRMLGRAYLAQMFRRYGNWPDALAAYNWGPGNVDLWIADGRDQGQLPLGVVRYIARVLHDALISIAGW